LSDSRIGSKDSLKPIIVSDDDPLNSPGGNRKRKEFSVSFEDDKIDSARKSVDSNVFNDTLNSQKFNENEQLSERDRKVLDKETKLPDTPNL
jgi:hypothetical protein